MAINKQKIYELLTQIPSGRVSTYKELALAIGCKSFRAVGKILGQNPDAPRFPCHRIVKNDGKIGGYAFGLDAKIDLLAKEGIRVKNGKVTDFQNKLFHFSNSSTSL